MYQDRGVLVNPEMIRRARRKSRSAVTLKIGDTTYKLGDVSKFRKNLAKLGILTILGVSALTNNIVENVVGTVDNAVTWVSDSVDLKDEIDRFKKEVIAPNTFRTSSTGAYMDTVNYNYSSIAHHIRENEANPLEGIYKVYSNDYSDTKGMTNEIVKILYNDHEEIKNIDDLVKAYGFSDKDEWADAVGDSIVARLGESGDYYGR